MANIYADYIFSGENIITMEEENPSAEALAVAADTIVAVGNYDQVCALSGPSTVHLNLKNGQTLLPGFIEPHTHASMASMLKIKTENNGDLFVMVDGYDNHSYDDVKTTMDAKIASLDPHASPLPWALFFGWDPELIPELPRLSKEELNKFSTEIPIYVIGESGHVAWVNDKAFKVAGVDDSIESPGFVKDENGHLTGQLFEEFAMMKILKNAPHPTAEDMKTAVEEQLRDYASRGFTTVTDMLFPMKRDDTEETNGILGIFKKVSESEACPVRLALYRFVCGPDDSSLPPKPTIKCCPDILLFDSHKDHSAASEGVQPPFKPNENLWVAGVKITADGSPHCGTSAIRVPRYLENDMTNIQGFPAAPNYGTLNYSDEELQKMVNYFHEHETQIAVHAHGEDAIDQVIKAYDKVLHNSSEHPNPFRHRIEHLGLGTVEQIEYAAKLNLALSFFVAHLYFYATSYTENIYGPERTNRWTPLSAAAKAGVRWSIHQDHPSFPGPPLPFANIKTAVTRTQRDNEEMVYGAEYRVTIHEAMKAVTIDAAWQIHKDDCLGSLKKGKKADLVILSNNPYKVDPFKLEEIKVLGTYMNGRPAYPAKKIVSTTQEA